MISSQLHLVFIVLFFLWASIQGVTKHAAATRALLSENKPHYLQEISIPPPPICPCSEMIDPSISTCPAMKVPVCDCTTLLPRWPNVFCKTTTQAGVVKCFHRRYTQQFPWAKSETLCICPNSCSQCPHDVDSKFEYPNI